jgi:CubicO group peptidase (beta-lactamase class C family)
MKLNLKYKLILILLLSISNLKAQESIDEIVGSYMSMNKIPGLSLAIVQNDSLRDLKAFGLSSLQQASKVDVNTTFELASLTKQFTATVILKLHQDGKLNLNDYLHQYFPECPEHWKEITIQQLLWHTSGLPGMFPHDSFTQMSFTGYLNMTAGELDMMMQTNTVSKDVAIKSIISDSLDSTPGTAYNYSDVGYLLLGLAIDNITGSYKTYLSDIFDQYGMTNTYFVDQEKVIKNQARGYSLKDGEWINIMRTWDYEIPSYFGVFSNVKDLMKWQKVISGTDFLNEQNQGLLFTKGTLNNKAEIPYGCGWEINDLNGLRFISHTGVTGTIVVSIPQTKTTVIMLSNLGYNGNDMVNSWNLAYELINSIGIETRINRSHFTSNGLEQVKATKRSFKKLVGSYLTTDNTEAKIYVENGKGYFESQRSKNELSLLEDGSWLVLGFDYEYILTLDESGKNLTSNYGRIFKKE